MKITFYQNSSTTNRVDKSSYLTEMITIDNVKLKETESALTLGLELKYNSSVFNSNYFYCEQTGRYYFITDIKLGVGNKIYVVGSVDVLYTFKDSILNSSAIVEIAGADPDDEQKFFQQSYPFEIVQDLYGIDFPTDPFTQTGNNYFIVMAP